MSTKYLKLIVTSLLLLMLSLENHAQVIVGQENNVGVRSEARIDADSSSGLFVQTKGNLQEVYRSNIFSFCRSDTFNGGSTTDPYMHNIWNYSWWNMRNPSGSTEQTYGFRNVVYNERMGAAERRGGIENTIIENPTSPSEGGAIIGIGNQGHHRGFADSRGIENRSLFYATNASPRYGMHNSVILANGCRAQPLNQPQYGIYNYFEEDTYNEGVGESGTYPNHMSAALYSTIVSCSQTNRGVAGYFDGDIVVTGQYNPFSDSTVKKNVIPIRNSLPIILQLNPVEFEFDQTINKAFPNGNHFGLLAQEVQLILSDVINQSFLVPEPDKVTSTGPHGEEVVELVQKPTVGKLTLNYTELIPILIKAVQEQQAQIEALEQAIGELQSKESK